MDLESELPVLREQYGSKASSNATSYTCDHVGIRRVKEKKLTMRLGIWKRITRFMKVITILSVLLIFCDFFWGYFHLSSARCCSIDIHV